MKYYINGDEPKIIGELCEGFVLGQFQENLQITDPANVAYFKFSGSWSRLYFEGSTIFWRTSESAPSEAVNNSFEAGLISLNLNEMEGVVGCKLVSIEYKVAGSIVGASLSFEQGVTLKFEYCGERDITQVKC